MLPSSSSIASKSSWDGGRGGSADSDSVGTIGHSVPGRVAEVRGRVTTVTTIGIPSKAAIAKAAIAKAAITKAIGTSVSISISRDASSETNLENY